MEASFDDNTTFAEDEKGEPICYDWLRDQRQDPPTPIRVQVKQSFVEKEWKLAWSETAAVMHRFDGIKRRYIDAALTAKPLPKADYCVYTIE